MGSIYSSTLFSLEPFQVANPKNTPSQKTQAQSCWVHPHLKLRRSPNPPRRTQVQCVPILTTSCSVCSPQQPSPTCTISSTWPVSSTHDNPDQAFHLSPSPEPVLTVQVSAAAATGPNHPTTPSRMPAATPARCVSTTENTRPALSAVVRRLPAKAPLCAPTWSVVISQSMTAGIRPVMTMAVWCRAFRLPLGLGGSVIIQLLGVWAGIRVGEVVLRGVIRAAHGVGVPVWYTGYIMGLWFMMLMTGCSLIDEGYGFDVWIWLIN